MFIRKINHMIKKYFPKLKRDEYVKILKKKPKKVTQKFLTDLIVQNNKNFQKNKKYFSEKTKNYDKDYDLEEE